MTTSAPIASRDVRPHLRGWLHLLMVPIAAAGGALLWTATHGGASARTAVAVFATTLVGLYAVSSAYHVVPWTVRARRIWSRVDGAMIQLFIAGTFTPIAFHALSGSWRVWSLIVAWGVALVGAGIAVSPLRAPRWVGTVGYVAIGWLSVVPFTRIVLALPWEGSALVVLGGVLYTLGAVVYAKRWPNPLPRWFGFHEVFHLLVVAGSVAHYVAIWQYVLPAV